MVSQISTQLAQIEKQWFAQARLYLIKRREMVRTLELMADPEATPTYRRGLSITVFSQNKQFWEAHRRLSKLASQKYKLHTRAILEFGFDADEIYVPILNKAVARSNEIIEEKISILVKLARIGSRSPDMCMFCAALKDGGYERRKSQSKEQRIREYKKLYAKLKRFPKLPVELDIEAEAVNGLILAQARKEQVMREALQPNDGLPEEIIQDASLCNPTEMEVAEEIEVKETILIQPTSPEVITLE